jgi:hypothetical protein
MSISSSGAITTTGVISGSNAASASYALNAGLLNNKDSAEFVATGSFNTFSSSILTYTGSANSRLDSIETVTGSNITRLSALESASGSAITRLSALETTSGSNITRLNSIESKTGSYATTGSNIFDGGQYLSSSFNPTGFSTTASLYTDGGLRVTRDAYISGTLYLNNVTVFGTQSVAYISSSQLNIGTNLITVNTDTPSVRFGGLAVYDSGSTGLTGSILWDSQNNHWVYSNPSGSSYSGGMFISGPRTSTLGSETGTTSCMLLAGQGGDHLTSSMIYHSSTATCIPNTLAGGVACFTTSCAASIIGGTISGTTIYGSTAVCSPVGKFTSCIDAGTGTFSSTIGTAGDITITKASAASFIANNTSVSGKSFRLVSKDDGNFTIQQTGVADLVTVTSTGNVGIGTTTPCALLHVVPTASNSVIFPVIINNQANCPSAGYGVGLRLQNSTTNSPQELNKWAGVAAIAGGSSGYSNETDLAFYVGCFILASNCTCPPVEKMRIQSSTGHVGIGATAPSSLLHICGAGTGAMLRIQNTSTVSGDQGPLIQFMSANQVGGQNFESGYIQSIWTNEGNGFGMRFATKGVDASQSEKMRITSGGLVLIGTSTLGDATGLTDLLTIGKAGSTSTGINFTNGTATRWGFIYINNAKTVYGSFNDIAFESGASATERLRISSTGTACFACAVSIATSCRAFGRNLTVQGDVVAYYSDQESVTMGISAGTGAQSWGIQVCDTGDGTNTLHLNARGGYVGINKGAGNAASYPLDVTGTIKTDIALIGSSCSPSAGINYLGREGYREKFLITQGRYRFCFGTEDFYGAIFIEMYGTNYNQGTSEVRVGKAVVPLRYATSRSIVQVYDAGGVCVGAYRTNGIGLVWCNINGTVGDLIYTNAGSLGPDAVLATELHLLANGFSLAGKFYRMCHTTSLYDTVNPYV